MARRLRLEILPQPDQTTCGPTALHAVYRYFNDAVPLEHVIREVTPLETGGTLAVYLGCHALRRGYRATIYSYNLQVFDPTWFQGQPPPSLAHKLREQMRHKADRKLIQACAAYLEYLALGGEVSNEDLRPPLIQRHLSRGVPLLTGLSSTYLYGCARELDDRYDDVRGAPQGHFVVLCGFEPEHGAVLVADPLGDNPRYRSHTYPVDIERLVGAIYLGIVTYDANLLVIEPDPSRMSKRRAGQLYAPTGAPHGDTGRH